MENTEKGKFKYYAFISYSHADKKIAKKLQRRLENYHLPTKLQKSYPNLPKNLNPIFMDESNLVAKGSLKSALQANLERTNYLIVICSPNSAKSEYVNDEVDYFIKLGRSDHIIPLIIDGTPHAEDSKLECFPPALLELTRENEPLGIDFKLHGLNDSFLRIIAAMLELDLDKFISGEERRRRKKIIIFSLIAAIFMTFTGIFIWHNTPHYIYYRDYIYRWDKPVGLFPVKSESERKKMSYIYRFTTLRGEVKQIERINSAGVLVDPEIKTPFNELPMIIFADNGVVDYYDLYKRKIFRKKYSNLEAVDFFCGDGIIPYSMPADMYEDYNLNQYKPENSIINNRSDIIRFILEYDSNGFVIKKTFRADTQGGTDKKGTPTHDNKGRFGFKYVRDNLGRITEVHNLDKNGGSMSVNGVHAEYIEYADSPYYVKRSNADTNGKLISDSKGRAFDSVSYDEYFNAVKLSHHGINGELVFNAQNFAESVYNYDINNGFLKSISYYDTNLNPCICKEGYFTIEFDSNKEGRAIKFSFYDTNKKITPCINGYSAINIKYNDNGQVLSKLFTDSENKPAIDFSDNIYGCKYYYEDGLMKRVDYLDFNGNIMLNKYGYASEICSYDKDENKLTAVIFRDENNKSVMASYGYAEEHHTYKGGNLSITTYHNESGDLIADESGIAKYIYEHKNGNLVSIKCFDSSEKPALNNKGYSRLDYEYNNNGLKISEIYYDSEYKQVIIPAGYAAVKYTYDSKGNKLTQTYYDNNGHYIFMPSEYYAYSKKFDYDDKGNIKHIQYLREESDKYQDMLDSQLEDIYFEYDNLGNETQRYFFNGKGDETDSNGKTGGTIKLVKEYDSHGRMIKYLEYKQGEEKPYIIQEHKRDSFGRAVSTFAIRYMGGSKEIITKKLEYDIYGNICKEYYLDGNNKLFIPSKQINIDIDYAVKKISHDISGRESDIFYYDEKGQPLNNQYRAFHTKKSYYPRGYVLLENYYNDENENEPCEISGCHMILFLRNELGQESERWLYDANKNFIRRVVKEYETSGINFGQIKSIETFSDFLKPSVDPDTGVFKIIYKYDSYGNQSEVLYFDADGEPCARIHNGKPTLHHYKVSYDSMGHVLSEEFFDTEGKPYLLNGFCKILRAYNSYGLCTEESFYDNEQNLINKKLIKYDSNGKKLGEEQR